MRDDPIMDILAKSPNLIPGGMTLVGQQISQISSQELVRILQGRLNDLVKHNDFKPGDVVKWKAGLKHLTYPAYGKPAIVVEVLSQPYENTFVGPESPYFGEILDLRIGVVADDGGFYVYVVPANRFEKF